MNIGFWRNLLTDDEAQTQVQAGLKEQWELPHASGLTAVGRLTMAAWAIHQLITWQLMPGFRPEMNALPQKLPLLLQAKKWKDGKTFPDCNFSAQRSGDIALNANQGAAAGRLNS
ncbi:hypothetical protein [Neolewinella agarilytica]|uniref:hypothetical protein n=1 Tax=Neolewinella agarilytica TaxID=478744 RepID=UPI001113D576|nr:hypothetical protein [Neolewinella agarilytica]